MEKLKTLKDLEGKKAINTSQSSSFVPTDIQEDIINDWIKHFFNLTPEDLK